MLPNFLIIGAQKAGTTFIHKCMREHPDIFLPINEVRFFENPEYLQTDFKQFEALFDDIANTQFMAWSIVSVCAITLVATLAQMRLRGLA